MSFLLYAVDLLLLMARKAVRKIAPGTVHPAVAGLIFWIGLGAGGCAFHGHPRPAVPPGPPAKYELRNVPFFPQEQYQCGPAALASALTWSGIPTTPQALAPAVFTPDRKGSLQSALTGAVRRHGRLAYQLAHPDDLYKEIAADTPVVVLLNLGLSWVPRWHYAVVIGYDGPAREMILHSETTPNKRMAMSLFRRTWKRSDYWGVVVLKPGQLPAVVSGERYVASLLGLERAGQFAAAAAGYQTATVLWPEQISAWMGLGNSYYRLSNLGAAETAFRDALRNHPQSGSAYNNLAMTLLVQGRLAEAREAARQAIDLGGPSLDTYLQTLAEVEAAIDSRAN